MIEPDQAINGVFVHALMKNKVALLSEIAMLVETITQKRARRAGPTAGICCDLM